MFTFRNVASETIAFYASIYFIIMRNLLIYIGLSALLCSALLCSALLCSALLCSALLYYCFNIAAVVRLPPDYISFISEYNVVIIIPFLFLSGQGGCDSKTFLTHFKLNTMKNSIIYFFAIVSVFLFNYSSSIAQEPFFLDPLPPCTTQDTCLNGTPWQQYDLIVTTMPGVPWNCTFHVGYTARQCDGVTEISGFNYTFDTSDPNCQSLTDSIFNNPTNRDNFLRNFYMAMPAAIAKQLFINFYNTPFRTPGEGDCPNSKKFYGIAIGSCMSFYIYKYGTTMFPIYWVQPYGCSGLCCRWDYEICYNTITHQYETTETRHEAENQINCNANGTELPPNQYEVFHTACVPICSDGHE